MNTLIQLNGSYTAEDLETIVALYKANNKVLVTMEWEGGRSFNGIKEQILVDINKWNSIKDKLLGININFGEINGKHSEIYGTLEEDEITYNSDTQDIVEFLKAYPSGHEYNHSFLSKILDQYYDEEEWYEVLGEEGFNTLLEIYNG